MNQFNKYKKLIKIIEIRNFINLILVSLLISIMEFLSVFSIYPVFYYLENKTIINNQYYIYIYNLFTFIQSEYVFEKILLISLIVILITSSIIYLRFSRKYKIKEYIINKNRKYIFKLIFETNLFFFKKIDQDLVKSYLSIETQRISQIILSFTNLCSSFFIIVLLSIFIIYVEIYLIFILIFTIFFLWLILSKTYAESKKLGTSLVNLNDKFMQLIDKILNDKTQFMLSENLKKWNFKNNDVVKNIHSHQYLIQKKSAFVEFVIKISTLSIILLVMYIFYINNVELSLILFSGLIFIRLVPYMSQFGNSMQNLKSNLPSLDKLIFIEKNLKKVQKIDVSKISLDYIDISSNILDSKNIEKISKNNFRIYPNTIYGLFGSSGIGKTTFLESLLGLDKNENFKIFLNGDMIIGDSSNPKILTNTSYFTQNFIPNSFLISEIFEDFDKLIIDDFFNNFDLKFDYNSIKNKKIDEFSGGEQQRLNLIYILLQNKKIIILDEPTSGLDDELSILVLQIIKKHVIINKNLCIIVSHDSNIIKNIDSYFTFNAKIKLK